MGKVMSDVMVRILGDLDDQRRLALEEFMRLDPGVISVGTPRVGSKMMVVLYNPNMIDTRGLLNRVTHHGYEAQLVGL